MVSSITTVVEQLKFESSSLKKKKKNDDDEFKVTTMMAEVDLRLHENNHSHRDA